MPHIVNKECGFYATPLSPPQASFNPTGLLIMIPAGTFLFTGFYTLYFFVCHWTQIEICVQPGFMAYRNWKSDKINIVRWWRICASFTFKAGRPSCRVNCIYTTGFLLWSAFSLRIPASVRMRRDIGGFQGSVRSGNTCCNPIVGEVLCPPNLCVCM